MRLRILVSLMLCLFFAGLWGWTLDRQCNFPANFYNMDINGDDVWAIGTAGAVAHSTDSGSTYRFVLNPGFIAATATYTDLNDVDFYDTTHGIIVGESGLVARTTDRGLNWTVLTSIAPIFASTSITSVVYHSDGKVWVCGAAGKVAYSTDNGDSWIEQTSGITNALFSISMNDNGTGFMTGNSGTSPALSKLLRTLDYGTTWTLLPIVITNNPQLYQVKQFGSTVVVMGDKGFVGVSTDNGDLWTNHELIGGATIKMQDACWNGTTGYVVGYSSTILKTTDNWATLTPVITDFSDYFEGIGFNAAGNLIASCWKGDMLRSQDSGLTWSERTVPINFIYGTSVVDNNTWYMVGDVGYIMKTTDGGSNFTRLTVTTGNAAAPYEYSRFYATYFKNALEGWVTGKTAGKIYHTLDGGATWSFFQVPGVAASKSYYKLQFINDTIGYAIGPDTYNAKTNDGGLTWTALANVGIPGGTALYSCYFGSELVGYATSAAGKLFLTQDGGANWTSITVGTQDIMDICFKDAQHGVFVAKAGNIYYTANGGQNVADWTVATESATGDINGLYCDTEGNFYASAYSSDADNLGNTWAVMKSIDNGAIWNQEILPSLTFNKTRLTGVTGKANKIIAFGGNQVIFSKSASTPPNLATDLFISEYIEGSSNNKSIEIFNGTGEPVSLAPYAVKLAPNGGAWGTTLTTNRILANNDVFIISNAGANATIQAVTDTISTVTYYNGNDAVGLFKNGLLIDTIGIQGVDPGATVCWPVAGVAGATLNHTIVRKPTVASPTTEWAVSAGTNADDSQWLVYPIDTITYLGTHTFTPGTTNPQAGIPIFAPPAGMYPNAINVTLTSSTVGAEIYYTTDGTDPTQASNHYTIAIPVNAATTIKARAYATDMDPSYIASAVYSFPVSIPNITALWAANADNTTVYRLNEEAILTFKQIFRNQKFIQDANAGVLIDDLSAALTSTYNVGDGITGIMGKLTLYGGMLEFIPVADPGTATSTGNIINPVVITLAELNTNYNNYKCRVVQITNVTFTAPVDNFANGITYPFGNGADTANFRTSFYDVDYIGTVIPSSAMNLSGIPNSRVDGNYFTSRNLADFQFINPQFQPPSNLVATAGNGTVHLTWIAPQVPGNRTKTNRDTRNLRGYQVYRDGTALGIQITDILYDDNTVTNGTPYTYYVTALYTNPNGESAHSNSQTVTPSSQTFNPPSNLQAVAGNALVTLSWNAPVAAPATVRQAQGKTVASRALSGYKVYRNESFLVDITIGTTTYLDNAVTNGTLYHYYVTAIYSNPNGESASSNVVSATPQAPVLNPPTNLAVQQVTHDVVLNWVAPVPAVGTTVLWINIYRENNFMTNISPDLITWTDLNVSAGLHTYKVSAGYLQGESVFSNEASVTVGNNDPVAVTSTSLLGAAPNPFNSATSIRYQVKGSHDVMIQIYNVKGQLVKTLVQETKSSGMNSVSWNGRDSKNQVLPAGIYFYKMKSGNYSSTKKVILLK